METGKSLKARMKMIGLTMKKISQETGVGYSSICMYMNGYQGLSLENKEKIDSFIDKMEAIVHDSNELETKEVKIKRLAYQVSVAMHEIIRIIEEDGLLDGDQVGSEPENG